MLHKEIADFPAQAFPRRYGHALKPCMFLMALPVLLGVVMGCQKRPDTRVLAVVGARVIEQDDFIKRYQDFRRRTGGGVPDHGEARRQVLQSCVEEELLITAARARGYHEDAAGRHEHERLAMQELLNAFNREIIAARVRVTEEEARQLFVRLNTKVKARHLYAPTRARADSLYAALQQGASFEDLAAATFTDRVLRNSGGALGYFTVDEMDPAFEEAAYRLAPGEISKPVRTAQGYSIIRVEERITRPLLSESEYAKHRDKLHAYWKARKIATATQAFVDSMRQALNISFNEAVAAELFARLQNDARREVFIETPNGHHAPADTLDGRELLRTARGPWTVARFREAARFTSEKQQDWIRNVERFEDFAAGLVVRASLLEQARAAKLDQRPEYEKKVGEEFDVYLLERMETALYHEMELPEDSLRKYFDQDPLRFAAPPQVRLREIVLRDSVVAGKLARQLEEGARFAELAKKHSARRRSAEQGGDLGWLTPQDLGRWSDLAFGMKPGERRGPVRMDSMFVLLECLARKPMQPRRFEQARADVEEACRRMKWDDYRGRFIHEMRQSVPVATYMERLNAIQMN